MTGVVEFIKIDTISPVVDYLTETISNALVQGKQVLWLVPGGSSISIAAEVSKKLQAYPLDKLFVTLTDERYGDVGHKDSNWYQLEQAGFSLPGATLNPVLDGSDFDSTVKHFANHLSEDLKRVNFRIGFFGIGPDGHTAGILPASSAAKDQNLTHGYEAGPFRRITMTPNAIMQLDEAVVYAVGETKHQILEQLSTDMQIDAQPAQALKSAPKLMIFNDHVSNNG